MMGVPSMTRIKHRSVVLGLALAALLVPGLAGGVPPAAAAARSAAVSSCDTVPEFLAVHGMNEGPDPTDPSKMDSTLLKDLDYAQNNLSVQWATTPFPIMPLQLVTW
jgi:hypothetical protein